MNRMIALFIVLVAVTALPHRHRRRHGPRIFGGNEATQGQFPFMVALNEANGYQWCDGLIVDVKWILTSADCADMIFPDDVILAGTYINDNTNGTVFTFNQTIIHEAYDDWTYQNDIALIQLNGELVYDDNILPIGIGEVGDNATCTTMGWGSTENESFPSILQYAEETTLDLESCISIIEDDSYYLGDETICAQGGEGVSTCFGDPGGPLVCDDKLAGIISYSNVDCGDSPDVFTRVAFYKDWIETKIAENTK